MTAPVPLVYVVAAAENGLAKIGMSSSVGRPRQLRDMNAARLALVLLAEVKAPSWFGAYHQCVAREVERAAHNLLSSHHSHGEWFRCSATQALSAVHQAADYVGAYLEPREVHDINRATRKPFYPTFNYFDEVIARGVFNKYAHQVKRPRRLHIVRRVSAEIDAA
jgi:hypothetical protein